MLAVIENCSLITATTVCWRMPQHSGLQITGCSGSVGKLGAVGSSCNKHHCACMLRCCCSGHSASALGALIHLLRSPSRMLRKQGEAFLRQHYHLRPLGVIEVGAHCSPHVPSGSCKHHSAMRLVMLEVFNHQVVVYVLLVRHWVACATLSAQVLPPRLVSEASCLFVRVCSHRLILLWRRSTCQATSSSWVCQPVMMVCCPCWQHCAASNFYSGGQW